MLKNYLKLNKLIKEEEKRQAETINLIPSENYVSKAVREATGSILTNKYSEGYPNKRYYPGNNIYDKIELLAQEKAKDIFKTGKGYQINVQPLSGTPANLSIYLALLKPGDTIMSLDLSSGGHLSHGHKVNFSGKFYKIINYGVSLPAADLPQGEKTGKINYDEIRKIAKKHKPKLIVSGFTAYPRKINFKKFHQIAQEVGAISMADISHIAGLIVAGLHPSPFPFTDVVMTTTHKTLRGPRGAIIISKNKFSSAIDKTIFPGVQGGPHNNITAAKLVCFEEASKPAFKKYQKQVIKNANVLAKELKKQGFNLVSGGTDNHLMLLDLTTQKISGKKAEELLEKAGINANRNSIPGDTRSPLNPSGLRLGTPAVTTRGMKEKEMKKIAKWIGRILIKKDPSTKLGASNREKIKREIKKFSYKFKWTI